MVATPLIIGNMVIEPRQHTVALRLVTDSGGYALFTYNELPMLAAHLKSLKKPEPDDLDDITDLV